MLAFELGKQVVVQRVLLSDEGPYLWVIKLKFLPPKAEFLLSNSRKRGSAFCLRFDLTNQFDGAFLPYC